MRARFEICVAGLAALLAGMAHADTSLSFRNTEPGEAGELQTVTITTGKVRMETGADEETFLLYHEDGNTFFAVQPKQKSYMELDPDTTSQMMDQASQMRQQVMEQLKERLAEMSEEQRNQMMEMMNRAGTPMPGVPREEVTYREGAGTATVSGLSCRWMDAYKGDRKVRELCLAQPSDLGMASGDQATMMAMQKSMKAMAERMGTDSMFVDDMPDGFPIHVRHFDDDGTVSSEQQLEAVSSNTVDAGVFEVPAGFTRQELPTLQMR